MAKLTGEQMKQVFKEESNVETLVSTFENFVNNFIVDTKKFNESLKNEEEAVKVRFATISLLWIKKCNYLYLQDFYDLRNEYSVKIASEIYNLLGDKLKDFYPEYEGYNKEDLKSYAEKREDAKNGVKPSPQSFEVLFVELMARSHRTLQQTFSGMIFNWLYIMSESMNTELFIEVGKVIQSNFDDGFYLTPMI